MFPSRNRAASHVRAPQSRMYHPWGTSVCFHLVIERLLISGREPTPRKPVVKHVSISLSSGFSFQVSHAKHARNETSQRCFHLVIERLLISGEMQFLGALCVFHVSISLSSGFSFQADVLSGLIDTFNSFHLVIERLLISGRHR